MICWLSKGFGVVFLGCAFHCFFASVFVERLVGIVGGIVIFASVFDFLLEAVGHFFFLFFFILYGLLRVLPVDSCFQTCLGFLAGLGYLMELGFLMGLGFLVRLSFLEGLGFLTGLGFPVSLDFLERVSFLEEKIFLFRHGSFYFS